MTTLDGDEELEALRLARAIIAGHNARVAELAAVRDSHPRCADCGEPAACMGCYEMADAWDYACNECCGHGCEDGECFALSDLPARYGALLTRLEALEEAASPPSAPSLEGPPVEFDEALSERARALIERADRGEGRHDVKVVVEYLRARDSSQVSRA